jgi:REP element-mobilizing transposase RayT
MPREHRFHEPWSYRHVTARGNDPADLFRDDDDRRCFLGLLGDVTRRVGWRCLGWCLMTTHYHLLVQERDRPLSSGMHLLHSGYVRAFNRRYDRRGHVFGGRYRVATIDDDAHLLLAIRYLARNPVEAGICASPADWPWSSYGQLVGVARPLSFFSRAHALSLFDARPERAVDAVRRLVEPVPGTRVPGT